MLLEDEQLSHSQPSPPRQLGTARSPPATERPCRVARCLPQSSGCPGAETDWGAWAQQRGCCGKPTIRGGDRVGEACDW